MDPNALFQAFTGFPCIPPELQVRIIGLTMEPRIIEVYIVTQGMCQQYRIRDFETYAVKLRGGPVPVILHINKAIRQEALRKYTAVAAAINLPPSSSLSGHIYVNPEIDTFYIIKKQHIPSYNSGPALPMFPDFYLMVPATEDIGAFSKRVRYVAIRDPSNGFLTVDAPLKNMLHQYQNLTSLDLIFDNRRKWTQPMMQPTQYKFIKAAGGRKCHEAGCNLFGKDCKLRKLAALLNSFEVQIRSEGNNEWKRPALGALAVAKKRA